MNLKLTSDMIRFAIRLITPTSHQLFSAVTTHSHTYDILPRVYPVMVMFSCLLRKHVKMQIEKDIIMGIVKIGNWPQFLTPPLETTLFIK